MEGKLTVNTWWRIECRRWGRGMSQESFLALWLAADVIHQGQQQWRTVSFRDQSQLLGNTWHARTNWKPLLVSGHLCILSPSIWAQWQLYEENYCSHFPGVETDSEGWSNMSWILQLVSGINSHSVAQTVGFSFLRPMEPSKACRGKQGWLTKAQDSNKAGWEAGGEGRKECRESRNCSKGKRDSLQRLDWDLLFGDRLSRPNWGSYFTTPSFYQILAPNSEVMVGSGTNEQAFYMWPRAES